MANRFHPIIYVRGYAMTRGEIDETTADPFCGFNIGSTMYRANADKQLQPRKFVFESPLVRLMSEYKYRDVYENGSDILDPGWERDADGKPTGNALFAESVIIHRYYDSASSTLGQGETPPIQEFAKRLSILIARVRELVCVNPNSGVTPSTFKVYLVAHSMGGLVCRAMLQNPELDVSKMGRFVDKFFTYATPHNGIDVAGINVPSFLGLNDANNFNRTRMAEYLGLKGVYMGTDGRVDVIPESAIPSKRVFCLVGTNRMDYETAKGLSRTFVGDGSDGLVKISNATLCGLDADGQRSMPCAKAFVFRSHSGYFGIVNSEEGFQNLARFLFGDLRVDIWLDVEELRLPVKLADKADVDALYAVEVTAAPRGKLWQLTRRKVEEDSVAGIRHQEWVAHQSEKPGQPMRLYLSTVFLSIAAKVDQSNPFMTYYMSVKINVPNYEVRRVLWLDEHFEGAAIFNKDLVLTVAPPAVPGGTWGVKYAWADAPLVDASHELAPSKAVADALELAVPLDSTIRTDGQELERSPGIRGALRFVVSQWNT